MGIQTFFYYGQGDLLDEIQDDLMCLMLEPAGGGSYFRNWGVGLQKYENEVSQLLLQVGLRYDIAESIAARNQYVSNGQDGTKDRRVICSQQTIDVIKTSDESRSVVVRYVPAVDIRAVQQVTAPLGGSR